jgi:hypothetical protein
VGIPKVVGLAAPSLEVRWVGGSGAR